MEALWFAVGVLLGSCITVGVVCCIRIHQVDEKNSNDEHREHIKY